MHDAIKKHSRVNRKVAYQKETLCRRELPNTLRKYINKALEASNTGNNYQEV